MKIAFFILFAIINLMLTLRVVEGAAKLKYLKFYGLAIPGVLVAAVLAVLLMKALNMRPDVAFKDVFFGVLLSVMAILLTNIMVIGAGYLVDMLLKFHTHHNTANIDRFPVSFVLNHAVAIKNVFRVVFFLGSLLMFYGIWFGKR